MKLLHCLTGGLLLLGSLLPFRAYAEEPEVYRSITVVQENGSRFGIDLIDQMYGIFDAEADFIILYPVYDENGKPVFDPDLGINKYEMVMTIPGTALREIIPSPEIVGISDVHVDSSFFYDPANASLHAQGTGNLTILTHAGVVMDRITLSGEKRIEVRMDRYGKGLFLVNFNNTTLKLRVK